jgi:hypothetical protein
MPYCHVCHSNGKKEEVCKSHNARSFTKCPFHPRHPIATREKPKTVEEISREEVAPDLRDAIPPLTTSPPPTSTATADSSAVAGKSALEILVLLQEGAITKKLAVDTIGILLCADGLSDTKEKQLNRCLTVASAYDITSLLQASTSENVSEAARLVERLQSKHGKLFGLLISVHKRKMHELHVKRRTVGARPIYESVDTGEKVVVSDSHDDVSGVALLHVVLVDFIYLAVAYGYITHTEGRALHAWVARKLYLHDSEHIVVWRVAGRFLEALDSDDTQDLDVIISRDSTVLWAEELDIAGVAAGKRVRGDNGNNKDKNTGELTAGDSALAVRFPARGMCWAHTNGKKCYDLDGQGRCNFSRWHGKCCGRILASGSTCKGAHRAVDCTEP